MKTPSVLKISGCLPSSCPLFTKDQAERYLAALGLADQALPGKGERLIVTYPPGHADRALCIEIHPTPSTYHKTLYAFQFYRAA